MTKLDNRGIHVSIVVVMLFQICSLFVREYVSLRIVEAGVPAAEARHWSALVGFVVLAVLMWPVFRESGPAIRPLLAAPASWLRLATSAVVLGVLIWLFISILLLGTSTFEWIGSTGHTKSARPIYEISCSGMAVLLLSIPVLAVLTPFFEEVVSRGLILHTLIPKGHFIAVVASAVLFMILHKPDGYPTAFIFGVFAAIQMLNWRNLWGLIITHGTVNFLVELKKACVISKWFIGEISWYLGGLLILGSLLCLLAIIWLCTRREIATAPN